MELVDGWEGLNVSFFGSHFGRRRQQFVCFVSMTSYVLKRLHTYVLTVQDVSNILKRSAAGSDFNVGQ